MKWNSAASISKRVFAAKKETVPIYNFRMVTTAIDTVTYSEAARRALRPEDCALAVIDIQEKLLPPIFEKDRLVRNAQLLVRLAGILSLPLVALRDDLWVFAYAFLCAAFSGICHIHLHFQGPQRRNRLPALNNPLRRELNLVRMGESSCALMATNSRAPIDANWISDVTKR